MKKAIAILLVLLVAGVMFAANDSSTLTLKSSIEEKLNHGFTKTELTTVGDILAATLGNRAADSNDNYDLNVDMEVATAQSVGFYSFASNSSTGVKVDIDTTPLVLEDGNKNALIHVPFTLSFSLAHGAGTEVAEPVAVTYISLLPSVDPVFSTGSVNIIDTTTGSPSGLPNWATYGLTVSFHSDNATYGLPEGDYVGTVVANITTN